MLNNNFGNILGKITNKFILGQFFPTRLEKTKIVNNTKLQRILGGLGNFPVKLKNTRSIMNIRIPKIRN